MNIKDISIDRTNDDKKFDTAGKNWFISFKFTNNKRFGIEIKPEMNLSEIVIELIKFANLIITKAEE